MRYYLTLFLLIVFLTGCARPLYLDSLEPSVAYQVAYNEHVQLNVGGVATEVKVNGVPVSFFRRGNVVFFDLSTPPFPFTGLPTSNTAYKSRDAINVSVTVTNSTTPFTRTYSAYGAVESGEVNLLLPLQSLQDGCPTSGFVQGYKIVNSIASTGGLLSTRICFLTLDIRQTQTTTTTRRGTYQAITFLSESLTNEMSIDRNVVFSADGHRPALSFDPSCEQLEQWVNNENSNKMRIDAAKIKTEVNANTAHANSIRGNGIKVAVIGGGVELSELSRPQSVVALNGSQNFAEPGQLPIDDFECDFDGNGSVDFLHHENHAIEIISTIAPSALIIPLKVSDHHGETNAAKIMMALMYLENTYNGLIIVNLSSGGPLRSDAIFRFLESDGFRSSESFFVVASSGNNGRAVPHYPATFSPLSDPPGSLPTENLQNTISVAAYAITTAGAYTRPLFNTLQNPDIFAAGVNICLPSVTLQCQTATDSGIGGSSFAAPVVAGVAALYAQAQPGANLYNLLTTNDQPLPGATLGRVWYQ
jgi:hypothetical protein